MRVAVYTIAKNEEQFVERWYESAKDADYILIADTGSTDGTVEKAKSLGINVAQISIVPWRFDDARNASMALLPSNIDLCISLDMDEVLMPGWREALDKIYDTDITRPRYKYTWNWNEDGSPGLQYLGDKIHARQGYRWKHPVHEVLAPDRFQETQGMVDLEIHHYADNTKSRSQYLSLLKLSVEEDPRDERNAFYYARELCFYNVFEESVKEFKRYLALPTAIWKPERARAYRYMAKCEPHNAEEYLLKAINEDPTRRESYVDMARLMYVNNKWDKCYEYSTKALSIKEKALDYLCEAEAWGSLPHDLASISAWNLNNKKEAIKQIKLALKIEPENQRFLDNLKFYQQ